MELPCRRQNSWRLVKLSPYASQPRCRKYLSPIQTALRRLLAFSLILELVRICHADLRCDHDDLASIQYSESVTTLAYDEAQANGQGSVFTQVLKNTVLK